MCAAERADIGEAILGARQAGMQLDTDTTDQTFLPGAEMKGCRVFSFESRRAGMQRNNYITDKVHWPIADLALSRAHSLKVWWHQCCPEVSWTKGTLAVCSWMCRLSRSRLSE